MPPIQALIFDMDGTMVHSMPWHAQAWEEYSRRHGMNLDVPAFMIQTTGKNAFECACALMGRTVSTEESERITAEKEGIYFGQCSELCGQMHAYMPITVKVVSEAAYAEWLAGAKQEYAGLPAPAVNVAAAN